MLRPAVEDACHRAAGHYFSIDPKDSLAPSVCP
jgi:hypothetical protein